MNETRKRPCLIFDIILDNTKEAFITNVVTCILNTVFSLLTISGNAVVLRAIQKTRALHSPSSVLLCCLAFWDLLTGMVCQPFFVAYKIAQLEGKIDLSCVFATSNDISAYIFSSLSLLTLAAVSVDRLLSLLLHLRYHAIVTVRRVLQFAFVLCVFVVTCTLLKFWLRDHWNFIPMVFGILTLIMITFCSVKIFQIARKHQRLIAHQTLSVGSLRTDVESVLKCKKSAVTILYIYALFLACFSPILVTISIAGFSSGYTRKVTIAYNYASTAFFINSFLNPIVYCWRIRKIRRAVKSTLKMR